ncbi:MAG: alpha-1,3-galactosidase B [Bacteroidales bacterium]|nr:alpha-1,3-galactosidase B [Bacteroidales bacterium]
MAILMVSILVSCKEKVYFASDFGIVPGAAGNISSKLNRLIDSIGRNSQGTPVRLVLEKGAYDFYPGELQMELYISNHDQDNPKEVAVVMDSLENFTLDGSGADFYVNGRMLPLVMTNCSNCTIENLNIDSRVPQITQVEIVENDIEEGFITYRLSPYVNYSIKDSMLVVSGENWSLVPTWGIAFEGDTKHIVYRTSDIMVGSKGICEIEPYSLKARWKDRRLEPGMVVAMRSYKRPTPGIFLYKNVNTTIKNTTVHYAEGMGLLAQVCENVALEGFNVSLRDGDGRYFTTQADATHFSGCKGHIHSVGGVYEGMMDDAINVHGTYLLVTEHISANQVLARYMHPQSYGFYWGGVGDSVHFVKSSTMEFSCANVIAEIEPNDADSEFGAKEFKITFQEPLPEYLKEGKFGIENMEWTPSVYFADNVIRNNRARGTLFSTPKKVVVENNLFDHTSGSAILLCGDCNGWFETGACRDVVIRGNHFVNALTNMFQFTQAVISIYPEIPDLENQVLYFHGGEGRGVVIEDNIFETFDIPILYAKSLDGLVFKGNKIIENNDYPPFHKNRQRFLLERVVNVDIEDPDNIP